MNIQINSYGVAGELLCTVHSNVWSTGKLIIRDTRGTNGEDDGDLLEVSYNGRKERNASQ